MIKRFWKNQEGNCWHFMLTNMAELMRMLQPLWLQCVRETKLISPIRSHLLPACRLTMSQELHQKQVRDAITAVTPKAPPRALDPERMMGFDSRDPRADPNQWPCHGSHTPMKPHGNAHGQWVHCAVCNLRLQYTPKKGSHSGATKVENPAMVKRMLDRLQPLMGDCRPTQQICLAMIKLIEAEEVLQVTINYEKDKHATMGYAKAKASPSRSSPSTTSPASQWSVVENPEALSAEDLQRHLTAEEKDQIQQLMRERQENANNENEMA